MVGNRLNSGQLDEQTLNYSKGYLIEGMKKLSSYEDKANLLFKFMRIVSESGYNKMKKFYENQDEFGKKEFIDDIEENGFCIEQAPMYGSITIEKFDELFREFGIEESDIYIYKWGRKKKLLNKGIIAEKYIYKLKHDPRKKSSARSTSFINSKDQPSKSASAKQNKSVYPTSSVKCGNMETMNLLISDNPKAVTKYNMQYSSSTIARREMNELYEGEINPEYIPVSEDARNKNAEMNNVYLKALGCKIVFDDEVE